MVGSLGFGCQLVSHVLSFFVMILSLMSLDLSICIYLAAFLVLILFRKISVS